MPRGVLSLALCAALLAAMPARADDAPTGSGSGGKKAKYRWPKPAAGVSRSGAPEIVFTFDDGPHEDSTGPILDVLAAHHIHAVFMWTGWRVKGKKPIYDRRRALVARAMAEGHAIGNHTVHHAHLCVVSAAQAEEELDENARLFSALIDMPLYLFRSPYGGRCKRLEKMLAERGLEHLHWDMDPVEWKSASTAETRDYLIDRIGKLGDGRRAVILLHDTKYPTMKALPQVLDWLDQENARRRAAGRREIKVVDFGELALEKVPLPFQELVTDSWTQAETFVPSVAEAVIAPLAGGRPAVSVGELAQPGAPARP